MLITKKIVADKIAAYLDHDITLAQLVDWAEQALLKRRLMFSHKSDIPNAGVLIVDDRAVNVKRLKRLLYK